jgi:thiol:disulfide interchange protein|tara:strand:- start:414 stop:671 length:258 start_codon:yes stop_codon:yes gene_type:complete
VNESRVFSNKEILAKLKELNVLLIKADNTKRLQTISDDFPRYGRVALPVNVIAPADPNAPVIVMPEVFGPEEALKALEEAAKASR